MSNTASIITLALPKSDNNNNNDDINHILILIYKSYINYIFLVIHISGLLSILLYL